MLTAVALSSSPTCDLGYMPSADNSKVKDSVLSGKKLMLRKFNSYASQYFPPGMMGNFRHRTVMFAGFGPNYLYTKL
jgi:hypothetical protein